jgi:hypothetical protein
MKIVTGSKLIKIESIGVVEAVVSGSKIKSHPF